MYSDKIRFEFEYIDPCLCNAWVATAVIGAGVLGAGASIYGANKAADAQTDAAKLAANTAQTQFDTTHNDLAPYRAIGNQASTDLSSRLSELTSPISVNPQDFTNSDMYKFLQYQGEKGVSNTAAARGLGTSGAALKGASAFETGLNSEQWQQNFNNQVTNQTNAFQRLSGLVNTGESASTNSATGGSSTANIAAGAQIGAGNAQAAGYNATGAAINTAANNAGAYGVYKGIYGTPGGSSAGPITYGGPNGPTAFS